MFAPEVSNYRITIHVWIHQLNIHWHTLPHCSALSCLGNIKLQHGSCYSTAALLAWWQASAWHLPPPGGKATNPFSCITYQRAPWEQDLRPPQISADHSLPRCAHAAFQSPATMLSPANILTAALTRAVGLRAPIRWGCGWVSEAKHGRWGVPMDRARERCYSSVRSLVSTKPNSCRTAGHHRIVWKGPSKVP